MICSPVRDATSAMNWTSRPRSFGHGSIIERTPCAFISATLFETAGERLRARRATPERVGLPARIADQQMLVSERAAEIVRERSRR